MKEDISGPIRHPQDRTEKIVWIPDAAQRAFLPVEQH
jgi:hypothetical protein